MTGKHADTIDEPAGARGDLEAPEPCVPAHDGRHKMSTEAMRRALLEAVEEVEVLTARAAAAEQRAKDAIASPTMTRRGLRRRAFAAECQTPTRAH